MKKELIKQTFRTFGKVFKKNSPTILTGLGVAGLVSTTVMAVRATPKALQVLEMERENKNRALTRMEVVKIAYPYYIPPILMGAATTGCIIGANSINLKRNAALASAYSLTEASLKEYKHKVKETLGEKKEREIRDEIAADRMEKNPVDDNQVISTGNGDTLCYEATSGRYFKSDIEKIRRVENIVNRRLLQDDFVSLNEVYDHMGLDGTKMGDEIGWQVDQDDYALITFEFSSQISKDGQPCLVVDFKRPPRYDYMDLL
jgi:hypothetical protein